MILIKRYCSFVYEKLRLKKLRLKHQFYILHFISRTLRYTRARSLHLPQSVRGKLLSGISWNLDSEPAFPNFLRHVGDVRVARNDV